MLAALCGSAKAQIGVRDVSPAVLSQRAARPLTPGVPRGQHGAFPAAAAADRVLGLRP